MFDKAELIDYVLDETERSVASDDFSHPEDAYNAGVGAAIDAIEEYLESKGL